MDENDVIDTFSEYYDKGEVKSTIYNVIDYVLDDMPVEEE